jgi:hypothetical protein
MQQLFLQAAFSAAAFSVSLCRCLVRCLCDAVDLFAAVLRESAVPRAEKLLGLQQAGAGLHFPTVQLDVGKGRDARLSDHMPSCLSQKAASFRSRL